MIEINEKLPNVTLMEYNEVAGECAIGPVAVETETALSAKTVVVFGLPGAFTPTCSAQHLPGYLASYEDFKALGVDEIWCVSVNDAFVMGAWAKEQGTQGKIRLLADGDAAFAKATGLTLDLSGKGLGLRSTRYSMLVKDGVVRLLNNEGNGALTISDANTLLEQIKQQ